MQTTNTRNKRGITTDPVDIKKIIWNVMNNSPHKFSILHKMDQLLKRYYLSKINKKKSE